MTRNHVGPVAPGVRIRPPPPTSSYLRGLSTKHAELARVWGFIKKLRPEIAKVSAHIVVERRL